MAYQVIGGKLVKVRKNSMGKRYLVNPPGRFEREEPKLAMDKGRYGGSCNITRCQRPNSAYWYNHSTRKFYCRHCAWELNNDSFNKRDAMEIYGHDLCTLWVPDDRGHDIRQLKDFLWTVKYDTVEEAWADARLAVERAALANAIDDYGHPELQVACAARRWMQITVDVDQPAVKDLLDYIEAGKDAEESPVFRVICQIHIDPEAMEDVVQDGIYLAAVARSNGGDYGAITFQGFDGRHETTEEAALPIVVNDGLREKVKKREPITFTVDFGVCAFT
jgi:hypothetical protein